MTATRRLRPVVVVVLVLLALTGCVQVPVSGPIEKVPGRAEGCQNCINVEVAPPAPGEDPLDVVDKFLRAMSNYQPNYATAKQFLTSTAADGWRPEEGVSVYRGKLEAAGTSIRLVGAEVGKVGADRTYAAQSRPLTFDFGLRQENGEWRVDHPPKGLMVEKDSFDRFYTGYSTYFVSNHQSLVPDRIYLPALRNPANIASALMKALLDGPSDWLFPSVTSSIPLGTMLSVDSVPITNGIAEVSLNDVILNMADPERSLMAAQIVYTLRQVPAVKGVLITVNKQKFRVLGADPTSLVINEDVLSREIDPVPFVNDQLYAVQKGRVYLVASPGDRPTLQPIATPGGPGRFEVDSLAVSINGTDLAVVTDGRTVLRRVSTTTSDTSPLEEGLTSLLRPQFTRYGEVWAIGEQAGKQRFWLSSPNLPHTVTSSVLAKGEITAFRISPDATRIALVRHSASGADQLGLARIVRNGTVTVEAWKEIDVTQRETPQLTRIFDLAWLDANELLVLGSPSAGAPPGAVRVAADGSRVAAEGDAPDEWSARELTVLSRPQTYIVVGKTGGDDQTWRRNGDQWQPFLPGVSTLAYAG